MNRTKWWCSKPLGVDFRELLHITHTEREHRHVDRAPIDWYDLPYRAGEDPIIENIAKLSPGTRLRRDGDVSPSRGASP